MAAKPKSNVEMLDAIEALRREMASSAEARVKAETQLRLDLQNSSSNRDMMLGQLLAKVDASTAQTAAHVKSDEDMHKKIEAWMDKNDVRFEGDDTDASKPGIKTRVDRLEQVQSSQKKWGAWAMVVFGGVLTALILFVLQSAANK